MLTASILSGWFWFIAWLARAHDGEGARDALGNKGLGEKLIINFEELIF